MSSPIGLGAKVLNEKQHRYAQVKRELWGIVSAIKSDRDNLLDWSRSSDRNGLSFDTRDDAVLYDIGCGYAKVDCIC